MTMRDERIDKMVAKETGFTDMVDMATTAIASGYRPTIKNEDLADAFDAAMVAADSDIRAWRGIK